MFIGKSCGLFHPPADLYPDAPHSTSIGTGTAINAVVYRRLFDMAILAQHGTRRERSVLWKDVIEDGKAIRICQALPENTDWRKNIVEKEAFVGSSVSAESFVDFEPGSPIGKGKLDLWSYAVRNEYNDEFWSKQDQARVEKLRQLAQKCYLGRALFE